mgnify:CR=1 FL=1
MLERSSASRLLLCVGGLHIFACCALAQDTFYYSRGKRVALTVNPNKVYVLYEAESDGEGLEESIQPTGAKLRRVGETQPLTGINVFAEERPPALVWAVVEDLSIDANAWERGEMAEGLVYKAPFVFTAKGEEVGISHLFYVKLNNESDRETLHALADQHNVSVIGNNRFMPLWYTLSCSLESSGNALEVANSFYESKAFAAAEPDFLVEFDVQSANDEHFHQQWGFENTGQHGGNVGIDINACDAWNHTTGDSSIIVAVLDHGIELNHPDMPNMASVSYDTVTGSSPSQVHGSHGTACAGIVGAVRNNTQGVAGIAPGTTLMSVSHTLLLGPNAHWQLANGISWAWQNGAHVISNSWGHEDLASGILDDAIAEALANGRGGLGTVVVFAAGNENGSVGYPANSNPEIVAVGAMSPCAERKNPLSCDGESWWGSNFGGELDVVAPGVLVPTTDRQGSAGYDSSDYTLDFNGTSSACPHVAGIVALILSVNPNLTQSQVTGIIESNAQKVGNYSYQTTAGRPNGTWNNEMGYGLVDAFACVAAAQQFGGEGGGGTLQLDVQGTKPEAGRRNHARYGIASKPVPTDLSRLSTGERPETVVISTTASTFDLWHDGRMHLYLGGTEVWVQPLEYLGSFGEIPVYQERSAFAWIWYFYPDGRIYFFTGSSGPHEFDNQAQWHDRVQ